METFPCPYKRIRDTLHAMDIKSIYIIEAINHIAEKGFEREDVDNIFSKYLIDDLNEIKPESINLILNYIEFVASDHIITEDEKAEVNLLKDILKITEGDFYNLAKPRVIDILNMQLWPLLRGDGSDNPLDLVLANELQRLFDLGYDELYKIEIKLKQLLNAK